MQNFALNLTFNFLVLESAAQRPRLKLFPSTEEKCLSILNEIQLFSFESTSFTLHLNLHFLLSDHSLILAVCVQGEECCSQLSISFHKVDPDLMHIMDQLLYRTTVMGRQPDMHALGQLYRPREVPPLP